MRMILKRKRKRKKRKLNQLFMPGHPEIPGENELMAPSDFNILWVFFHMQHVHVLCY